MKNRSEEIKLRIFVAFLFLACIFLISLAHILKNRHKKEVHIPYMHSTWTIDNICQ